MVLYIYCFPFYFMGKKVKEKNHMYKINKRCKLIHSWLGITLCFKNFYLQMTSGYTSLGLFFQLNKFLNPQVGHYNHKCRTKKLLWYYAIKPFHLFMNMTLSRQVNCIKWLCRKDYRILVSYYTSPRCPKQMWSVSEVCLQRYQQHDMPDHDSLLT